MKVRVGCCIPYCKRSLAMEPSYIVVEGETLNFSEVWICQKHWGSLPVDKRRDYSLAKRLLRKTGRWQDAEQCHLIFERNRDLAIDIAAGI